MLVWATSLFGRDASKQGAAFVNQTNILSHWVHCPTCGGRTRVKVREDTILVHFPLFCPKCKTETKINVAKLKMIKSNEPDV